VKRAPAGAILGISAYLLFLFAPGALLVLAQGSAVAPFIYTPF
jgi:hypothetical protein